MKNPRLLLSLSLILLLLGFLLPLLMVMRILPLGFFLSFLAWASSVSGLLLGLISVAMMVKIHPDR
jgi:hypothetical protein